MLLDRPPAVQRTRDRLEEVGLVGRCELIAGDFFEMVPAGSDAYVFSGVVHDWDNEAAVRILTNCRQVMGQAGTFLQVEALLPERAREVPAMIRMDLHMLALVHGRERTVSECERLLGAAGFQLRRVLPTKLPAGASLLDAIPAVLPNR
jgi:hypothetical protein